MRIALELETQLHVIISTTTALSAWLFDHWSDSRGGEVGAWERYPAPAESWYSATFHRAGHQSIIQVDVLGGAFLVNGRPVGRLPEQISESECYVRLFRDSIFDVQPAHGGRGYKTRIMGGACFGFDLEEDGQVIITEEREVEGQLVKATLVPHQSFQGDLPISFVEDYSHWLVRGKGGKASVYFRPIQFDHPDNQYGCSVRGAPYVLHVDSMMVIRSQDSSKLVDVRSDTFHAISSVLRRLEDPDHIHIFRNDAKAPEAILPRRLLERGAWGAGQLQNLHFQIIAGRSVRIISREFGGEVAADQNIGTLVGLQHGLLLETTHEKKLLLPHSEVLREIHGNHCLVKMNLGHLLNPPVFVYSVREDLRELRGQKDRVAWLYLAKLHALTSHVLRDPFTLRTGTETSLGLLRSARCRGNLSNGADVPRSEAERTLQEIARLSPVRQSKNGAEVVNFQQFCALCAHEGFAFLARDALQEISEQQALSGLQSHHQPQYCLERCGSLAQRAYFRSSEIFGLPGRLEAEEEAAAAQPCRPWQPEPWHESLGGCQEVRDVAFVIFGKTLAPPPERRPCLKSLLLTNQSLQGCGNVSCEEQSVGTWELMSGDGLRHWWLTFFRAAKRGSKEKCSFMLAYFASRWPHCVAHLQVLASICLHSNDFRALDPPAYSLYIQPNERDLNANTVQGIIRRHLRPFKEARPQRPTHRQQIQADQEYKARKQEHNHLCAESLQRLQGVVNQRWLQKLRAVQVHDCEDHMVQNALALAGELNGCFERWWRAAELHAFLEQVENTIQQFGGASLRNLLPWSSRAVWGSCPAETRTLPPPACRDAFNLSEPLPSELEEHPLDDLWEAGAPKEQFVLKPTPAFQPPPRRSAELQLARDEGCSAIYAELSKPLHESWRLAQEMKLPQISDGCFPTTLSDDLQAALEARQKETDGAWQRVLEAMHGQGRFDALMRSCGLLEEPAPLYVLSRLLREEGQLTQ
ncbi:unnamed protein product, partial [Symbiodinium natans]